MLNIFLFPLFSFVDNGSIKNELSYKNEITNNLKTNLNNSHVLKNSSEKWINTIKDSSNSKSVKLFF